MHPIGIILLLVLLYFIGFGTRRSALAAMVVGVLYLTQGQVIEVGVHLYAIRILSMALLLRVVVRREFVFSRLTRIDHVFLILYAYTLVVFLLRSPDGQLAEIAEAVDACCCYFGLRGVIRSEEDLIWLLRTLVMLLVPYVLLIGIERVRGQSAFLFMGGLTAGWEREGATRCMGSFRYPVALGTFAATFLALYVGLWRSRPHRWIASIGIAMCVLLVWASNSGGSFGALITVVVGWSFWYFRKNMRVIRWSIAGILAALSVIMKAPVWFIVNRFSLGGTSWHRAYLMDVAFRNIGRWWLAGMSAAETAHWFPYIILVSGGADITNEYLLFGLTAGVLSMVLLIVLLVRVFAQIGRTLAKLRATRKETAPVGWLVWGLGVMMLVHVISWLGVSYFDQMYVIWFLQLAAVTSITDRLLQERREPIRAEVVVDAVPA
jgi:hypothetical protein